MPEPEIIFFTVIYTVALIFAIPSVAIGNYLTLSANDQTKVNKMNKQLRFMILAIPLTLIVIIILQYKQFKLKKLMIHRGLVVLLIIYIIVIMIYTGLIKSSYLFVPDPKNPTQKSGKLKRNPSFFILIGVLFTLFIGGTLDFLLNYYDENMLISGFLNE
jgi:FtsH-binding integral membrane protein